MICATMTLRELAAQPRLMRHIAVRLTREGSDFQRKLLRFDSGFLQPTEADGRIAIVMDGGVPVGWARSEKWADSQGVVRDTLEAFVEPSRRNGGMAQWAAAGLFAANPTSLPFAVFRDSMLGVAKKVGVRAVLFEQNDSGVWVRA